MDRPEHFVSASGLAESFSIAMGQLTEHIMQQNQQFQSLVLELLNQRPPAQEYKVEGTSMPHFPGCLTRAWSSSSSAQRCSCKART